MKKVLFCLVLLSASLWLGLLICAESEIIYVNKEEVKIKDGPDESVYKTVAKVKYREKLEVIESKDDWYKVKVFNSGAIGWILKSKTSTTQPQRKKSFGESMGKILRGGSGSETAETAATAGIRDFDKANYQGLKGDFSGVERMEQFRSKIKDQDIINFINEGQLK